MPPAGVEMRIGVVNDPQVGPTIACGPGGALLEVMNDISVRLSPLARSDAASILRDVRNFRLLEGYRGSPHSDNAAPEDAVFRISALAEDHPDIVAMDCNPVILSASGVVDTRIRVAASARLIPYGHKLSFAVPNPDQVV